MHQDRGSEEKDAHHIHFSRSVLGGASHALHPRGRDVDALGSRQSELGDEHCELLLAIDRTGDRSERCDLHTKHGRRNQQGRNHLRIGPFEAGACIAEPCRLEIAS